MVAVAEVLRHFHMMVVQSSPLAAVGVGTILETAHLGLLAQQAETETLRALISPEEATYDALGNITKLIDGSSGSSSKTTYYTYDTLSRLLTASKTGAVAGGDYKYTYAYDLLGNITSGLLGSYAYAGSGGSSYANPDAATAVALKTLTYDNNGNLTALGTSTYSWNYRNRLTQSGSGLATSTYGYDDADSRVPRHR